MSEKKKHVAWLSGGYHRRHAMMTKIREKFSTYEYVVVDGSSSFEFLMSKLRSGGCFESGRIISVVEIPKTSSSAEKKKYLSRLQSLVSGPMKDCFLVFNGIDPSKERALFGVIKDHCKHYDFETTVDSKEVISYIASRAKSLNLQASPEILQMIADYCGKTSDNKSYDADKIEMALTSLSFVVKEEPIQFEHVASVTFKYDNFIIWELMSALDEKNIDQVWAIYSKILNAYSGSELKSAINNMFGVLLWKYRLIMMIVDGYRTKKDRDEILSQISSMRRLSKQGMGLSATYEPDIVKSGANAGKPAAMWSEQVVSIAMDGMYGGVAAADKWNTRRLYPFMQALTDGSRLLRGASDQETLLIADIAFMAACELIDRTMVKRVHESLERNYATG